MYKCISSVDGHPYAVRRIDGLRIVHEAAMQIIGLFKKKNGKQEDEMGGRFLLSSRYLERDPAPQYRDSPRVIFWKRPQWLQWFVFLLFFSHLF